jgi:hypothetical protein
VKFNLDGICKDLDINYFEFGKERNVVDDVYIDNAIKEIVEYIKRNKGKFLFLTR